MKHAKESFAFIFATVALAVPLLSQTAIPVASQDSRQKFEVVSVKANSSGSTQLRMAPEGDRFVATNVPLSLLLQFAFRPSTGIPPQMFGVPGWADTDRFDIQAKGESNGGSVAREQMQLMVQSLLEDRFNLKAHREPRELPVYDLFVARGGLKIKPSLDQSPIKFEIPPPKGATLRRVPLDPGETPRGIILMGMAGSAFGTTTLSGKGIPIANFVNMLPGYAGRPIVDKTGLNGLFDLSLEFVPQDLSPVDAAVATADPSGPSLVTALEEQLGLKLESSKGPVEVLVIDSVQKPSEN